MEISTGSSPPVALAVNKKNPQGNDFAYAKTCVYIYICIYIYIYMGMYLQFLETLEKPVSCI